MSAPLVVIGDQHMPVPARTDQITEVVVSEVIHLTKD
jgi:hypothetical protein